MSRYLFIFFEVYFLILGLKYLLEERNIQHYDQEIIITKQRINILSMTLIGYLIVAFDSSIGSFNIKVLALCLGTLVFYFIAFFTTDKIYKKSCPLLWNGVFLLLSISLITLSRLNLEYATRQLGMMYIGYFLILIFPYGVKLLEKFKKIEDFKYIYLVISFFLFGLTFILAKEIYGAKNWISIFGIGFQPSEIIKILFVLYFASVFKDNLRKKQLVAPIIVAVIFVLALVLQKDLGGALIFFMTFIVMLYIASGSIFLVSLGTVAFSIACVFAYFLFAHVRVRVVTFINPWDDFYGKGNQIINSLFAIGSGGFLGSGLKMGMPFKIPVVESDFIFSAIAEEFGGIFVICLIAIYVVIYYRAINISLRCKNNFFCLVSAGITAMIAFQTFLIIGGVIKLIPLTGVTLPFISYGGSSLIVSMLMIGILQWIYNNLSEENRSKKSDNKKVKVDKKK